VERWHWLTEQQLLDAVAVGQVTPGPLFTTATFIGYVLAGVPGAVVSTIAIFTPAFVFVALTHGWIERLRRSAVAGAALDGLTLASVGLMAAVTLHLGHAAIVDLTTAVIAAAALAVLLWRRPNATWLIAGGALAGWVLGR
jgi:chromate transporter